ncbi:MAG TPA: hypothetical protein VHE35_06975 [Kofleriaceae bacterium]|nr:hypothetical protein [Kofleriaceae bacterium]
MTRPTPAGVRSLAGAVAAAVAAATTIAALAACTSSDGDPCTVLKHGSYSFTAPYDPSLYLKVESCRIDAGACVALCSLALHRAGIGADAVACDAAFDGDRTSVTATYSVFSGGEDCPVFDGLPTPTPG